MKIPFKDAIGKNDLLHITLMNCLTPEVIDSAREKEEYEVRLVVNGVDLDPTTLNLFQDKAEEWVELLLRNFTKLLKLLKIFQKW